MIYIISAKAICKQYFLLIISVFLSFGLTSTTLANDRITIGTGGNTGTYYRIGKIMCQSTKRSRPKIRCRSKSTKGSVANLRGLRKGKFDVVVAQSVWGWHALNGTSVFSNDGADTELRSVFSFHPEPMTIVARKDANIRNVNDLRGKRINVGPTGLGNQRDFDHLLKALGWSMNSFSKIGQLKAKEQGNALCANQFDAVIYMVGYPSGHIIDTSRKCDVTIVELTGPKINKLVRSKGYFRHTAIPWGYYKGITTRTKTFGLGSVVLTRDDVPDEVIYALVKAVFSNLGQVKLKGPYWQDLKPSEMIKDSLTAKLHPGAARYYRERGWLK